MTYRSTLVDPIPRQTFMKYSNVNDEYRWNNVPRNSYSWLQVTTPSARNIFSVTLPMPQIYEKKMNQSYSSYLQTLTSTVHTIYMHTMCYTFLLLNKIRIRGNKNFF